MVKTEKKIKEKTTPKKIEKKEEEVSCVLKYLLRLSDVPSV